MKEITCPGQLRCLGRTVFFQNLDIFGRRSRTASLVGAEPFPEMVLFGKKPIVRGSFVAWDSFPELCLKNTYTCPWQLRCLGQFLFSPKCVFYLNQRLVRGSCVAWGIFWCPEFRCPGVDLQSFAVQSFGVQSFDVQSAGVQSVVRLNQPQHNLVQTWDALGGGWRWDAHG